MTDSIEKFFRALDSKTKTQLKAKLLQLKADPFGMTNVKKLKNWGENAYRLRVGKIRIIYKINEAQEVEVLDVDYRGNIY